MKNILLLSIVFLFFSCDLEVIPDDVENINLCDKTGTPVAKIITNSITCVLPDCTISFDASTSANACSFQWDVDGNISTIEEETVSFDYTFTTVGVHTVTLWIENSDAEIHSTQVSINVTDSNSTEVIAFFSDSISNSGFAPATVYFFNGSSHADTYEWDFGDGVGTSTDVNPNYTYQTAGTYVVKLIAIGATTDSTERTVVIEEAPVAEFVIVSGNNGIAPVIPVFNNTSTNADIYEWDFGDGGTSTDVNPNYTYQTAGTFTITLTVGKTGTTYQDIYQDDITIQGVALPVSGFTIVNYSNNGCAPTIVSFNSTSTNATSYEWDFGDGQTSTLENPSHTYSEGGNFTVKLKAINAAGENISTDNITIDAFPTFGKHYGGNSTDTGRDIVQNSSGGYAILGTKEINGSKDITLTLTDKNGNVLNDFTYESSGVDEDGVSIINTQNGGYAIVGNSLTGNNPTEIKLWILNENGEVINTETFGGFYSTDLIQKDNGDFVILGSSNVIGTTKPYLIFTNSNGLLIDDKTYDLEPYTVGVSMDLTSSGKLAILANSFVIDIFTGDVVSITVHLLITDLDGIQINDYAYDLGILGSGIVETATGGYGIICHSVNQSSAANNDIHFLLIDESGSVTGHKLFGGNLNETSSAIVQTQNGFAILGTTESYGNGMNDFYLILTNVNGNNISTSPITFGGQQDDFGGSLIQTQDGGLGVLGTTSSLGAGASNIYFVKTDASGSL